MELACIVCVQLCSVVIKDSELQQCAVDQSCRKEDRKAPGLSHNVFLPGEAKQQTHLTFTQKVKGDNSHASTVYVQDWDASLALQTTTANNILSQVKPS